MTNPSLFTSLRQPLEDNLHRLNPWWRGNPQQQLPPTKRWAFPIAMSKLKNGPAKVTVLSGPRQVGKSTLVSQIIETFLTEGVPADHIFYIQFDELPELLKLRGGDPSPRRLVRADHLEENFQ